MLQEASKLINSAFQQSFLKRLCQYLHDCIREEVKSATFRNLNQDKDNQWVFLEEEAGMLISPNNPLKLSDSDGHLTKLMVHADTSQKDKYLMFGFLFVEGKSGKKKVSNEFLTPLLYIPCRLERSGTNLALILTEETISLNTGALSGLLNYDDEDQAENLFGGLIDVVPDYPVTHEKMQIFLTTLKSIIPELDISECASFFAKKPEVDKDSDIAITNKSAVILTKRPTVTAGVLHELTQMAEKPSGVFRETSLRPINEEFMGTKGKISVRKSDKDFCPITPLSLSESQTEVLKAVDDNTLITVFGPPGTGKSQTIVNLVTHLVANGKSVLVASRMDKAVDVVVERLSEFGAPYLALRAGRANYQKQLNFEIQDILSNKLDLDTGFEGAVFADIDDMKTLLKNISDTQKKADEIIKLEHIWYEILEEYKTNAAKLENEYINKKLSDMDISIGKSILKKIEKVSEGTNFFNKILFWIYNFQLRKSLMLKNLEFTHEAVIAISEELEVKELYNRLKSIEQKINKIGNLHVLLQQVRDLKTKQRKLAIDILKNKRRKALNEITRDQAKRQRLMVHSKALIERKKNLQNRLLEDEDFQPLVEAFPCWAVTTYAVSESLPLKAGLFDVAIIDEASQCDIASCFPIMFRAKKTIVVGDDKQLPHLSFLEKAKEQSFFTQYNIPDKYQLMWRFRTNSVFDLANYYSTCPILLDEHFRSLPPIIDFSNKEFYGSRLRIMNKETKLGGILELHIVEDAKVDPDATRNAAEVEKLLERLQEIMQEDAAKKPKKPVSIGIISPFRGQVELIKKAVAQVIPDKLVRKHEIDIGTAHTFQGDERDIIMLSFALAPNSHNQSLTFVQKPNLFNVAITRARKKLICFISKKPQDLPAGLMRDFLNYIRDFNEHYEISKRLDPNLADYNNKLEREIAQMCIDEGLEVLSGFETAGMRVDLITGDGENQIAVECDGMDDEFETCQKQVYKQTILERCGFKVVRITAREWYYSQIACIEKIKRELIDIKISKGG
ncbi:MAG: AAA domain-containing protein [Candidatus Gastranaerophilales bacterium]|nr:AAA domain-containing protein [Candidatus Gastranaerophilales bacterium]